MKLEEVIDRTLELHKNMGYTENTWKLAFRNGRFSAVRKFYAERGQEDFDSELTKEYVAQVQRCYENGEFSYAWACHLKKKAMRLIEVYETGTLVWRVPQKSKITVNPYFVEIWQQYLGSKTGILSISNLVGQKSSILHFLGFLQHEKGYCDFSHLSREDIHAFLRFKSQQYKGGRIDRITYAVRYFLTYLFECEITKENLTDSLYQPAQKKCKILPGFTVEEVDRILAQPDQNTATGKRDYAILLLARNTGLRIGDITGLQLSDIDWRTSEISICQKKTGKFLTLPLDSGTEEAIAEYILQARPQHHCLNVFLKAYAPHGPLTPQALVTLFSKYRFSAGIVSTPYCGKSFHGLRRSIACWMLQTDVPLTTISQVLGHSHIDSTVPYLSFDEKNLLQCAISLTDIECRKEGLV